MIYKNTFDTIPDTTLHLKCPVRSFTVRYIEFWLHMYNFFIHWNGSEFNFHLFLSQFNCSCTVHSWMLKYLSLQELTNEINEWHFTIRLSLLDWKSLDYSINWYAISIFTYNIIAHLANAKISHFHLRKKASVCIVFHHLFRREKRKLGI